MTRYTARPYGDAGHLWYVEDANFGSYLVSMLRSRDEAERYAADLNAADE